MAVRTEDFFCVSSFGETQKKIHRAIRRQQHRLTGSGAIRRGSFAAIVAASAAVAFFLPRRTTQQCRERVYLRCLWRDGRVARLWP